MLKVPYLDWSWVKMAWLCWAAISFEADPWFCMEEDDSRGRDFLFM